MVDSIRKILMLTFERVVCQTRFGDPSTFASGKGAMREKGGVRSPLQGCGGKIITEAHTEPTITVHCSSIC